MKVATWPRVRLGCGCEVRQRFLTPEEFCELHQRWSRRVAEVDEAHGRMPEDADFELGPER